MAKKAPTLKTVETLKHEDATRKNIPTAEHQSVLKQDDASPRPIRYPRNTDIDPQLVWRGKDEQDWSDLVFYHTILKCSPAWSNCDSLCPQCSSQRPPGTRCHSPRHFVLGPPLRIGHLRAMRSVTQLVTRHLQVQTFKSHASSGRQPRPSTSNAKTFPAAC